MKFLVTLAAIFLMANLATAKNIPGTKIKEKMFDGKFTPLNSNTLSLFEIHDELAKLNQYLGSYPPNFKNEKEREQVYKEWLELASQIEGYANNNPEVETTYSLRAELYRDGHNMDIVNAAPKARSAISTCLEKFPDSENCRFQATYFYLSIDISPETLQIAEENLSWLRKNFQRPHPEVEAGYVFLYLYRQDMDKAKTQLDYFINQFPNSSHTDFFKKVKANLGEKIEVKNF